MVPDQMTIWRRDQGGQAAHKVEWIENQTRDTPGMRPWAPQLVGDATIGAQAEPFLGERRREFREYWTRLCRSGKPGRPAISREVRDLIRRMSSANPFWGAPRIVGELGKIGIDLPKSTVAKYMVRHRRPPSPTSILERAVRHAVGGRSAGAGGDSPGPETA